MHHVREEQRDAQACRCKKIDSLYSLYHFQFVLADAKLINNSLNLCLDRTMETEMEKRSIPESELILNADGSVFHLHLLPEDLADDVILVGDPGRVDMIAGMMDSVETRKASREFHSAVGSFSGRRMTVLSTGIGADNIDIVMTELDALANVDFRTRQVKENRRSLRILRIGTSGSIREDVPVGSMVFSEYSVGFDGLLNWYAGKEQVCSAEMEHAFTCHMDWPSSLPAPYFIAADRSMAEAFSGRAVMGMTVSAPGFYGPQGRYVRMAPAMEGMLGKLASFRYGDRRIVNIEMESSSVAGLSALMGHRAATVCCIIAGRYNGTSRPDYQGMVRNTVLSCLETMASVSDAKSEE